MDEFISQEDWEATVQENRIRQEQEQEAIAQAYKNIFSTPDGKKVLKDICYAAGLYETRLGDFEAGQRNVALRILNIIEYEPKF